MFMTDYDDVDKDDQLNLLNDDHELKNGQLDDFDDFVITKQKPAFLGETKVGEVIAEDMFMDGADNKKSDYIVKKDEIELPTHEHRNLREGDEEEKAREMTMFH